MEQKNFSRYGKTDRQKLSTNNHLCLTGYQDDSAIRWICSRMKEYMVVRTLPPEKQHYYRYHMHVLRYFPIHLSLYEKTPNPITLF